jgi:uncharacterized protein YegJ (DUF2314 family)
MWLSLTSLALAGAPPPLPPDARFAIALFCAPTCEDTVFDAVDAALSAIPARDGFPADASRPMRIMGIAGPEFGIPDAAFVEQFGVGVDRPDALQQSQEVLLAWFAGPRDRAVDTFAAAHAAFALAAERSNGWVYDLDTQTLYGSAAWKAADPRRGPEGWYMVDAEPMDEADPDGPVRVLTRGLRRYGDFELLVEDVDPAAAADVAFVLNAVATAAHGRSALPDTLRVDSDSVRGKATLASAERRDTDPEDPILRVRFEGEITVPVEQDDAAADDGAATGAPAAVTAMDVAPSPAAAAVTPVSPSGDVPLPATPSVAPRSLEEAQAQARARLLGPLRVEFSAGLPAGAALAVKAPFRTRSGGVEYMWVELRAWTDASMRGTLLNEPWDVEGVKKGDTVDVRPDDVFDYLYKRADGTREGNTTAPFVK